MTSPADRLLRPSSAPRYTVTWAPINGVADAKRAEEQARIAVKLAWIDAHPHRDPVYRPERIEPTSSQVAAATARASIYRVELTADELAEVAVQETRDADRLASLLAAQVAAPDPSAAPARPRKAAGAAPSTVPATPPNDISDRAARLSAAAHKAWATRRARAA